jgi:nucleotidyltransferase substrate binding protein (TIGR01987 family)
VPHRVTLFRAFTAAYTEAVLSNRVIPMPLDLTPLRNAVTRLREMSVRYRQGDSDEAVRDALIHRFAFTYELAHKMLKRYFAETAASPGEFNHITFADLIRTASDEGLLLGDWPAWRRYRDMRARTSHTYDEAKALEVVAGIDGFLAEAEYLLSQLETRQT